MASYGKHNCSCCYKQPLPPARQVLRRRCCFYLTWRTTTESGGSGSVLGSAVSRISTEWTQNEIESREKSSEKRGSECVNVIAALSGPWSEHLVSSRVQSRGSQDKKMKTIRDIVWWNRFLQKRDNFSSITALGLRPFWNWTGFKEGKELQLQCRSRSAVSESGIGSGGNSLGPKIHSGNRCRSSVLRYEREEAHPHPDEEANARFIKQ